MSPNYVRLDGPNGHDVKGLDRKYALWLYREGGLQMDFKVAFIPRCMPWRFAHLLVS
jgi:hypothetical protein